MAEINERASVSVDCPLSPIVSDEAGAQAKAAAHDSFSTMKEFIKGQVNTSVEDFKLLEEMNKTTALRYQDMHQVSKNITSRLGELNEKCKE